MKLRAKPFSLEVGGKYIVILNKQDAEFLGLHALDRVKVKRGKEELIAIVNITEKFAEPGEIVTNNEVSLFFNLRLGDELDVTPAERPKSVSYIKHKIVGGRLEPDKIRTIIQDVVDKNLSDIELAAFITALDTRGLSMDEIENLSRAMVETGKTLNFKAKFICDKHSCGGIPGDKTSLLVVPIVAAAGLTIPKTSSRAITSPAGTADRMEVLAPVNLTADEIIKIVKKTKGCLTWGGALDLAPADDAFVQIEYPLGIDPLMLPSIISKKKAVGAKYVIIDIPTGRGAKIKTVGTAHELADDFIRLGNRLGMNIACAITFGEQPLGYCIGPALEAQEALLTLQGRGPADLIEKVTSVVGVLFDLIGVDTKSGKQIALDILKSGKAEKKFREIIAEQGGNPKIKVGEIPLGDKRIEIKAENEGRVLWIKNAEIAAIAREAGAPKDNGAGIKLAVKINSNVKKGDTLFTIFSSSTTKLNSAAKLVKDYEPLVVGKTLEERMLLDRVPTKFPHRRLFMLER